MYKIIFIGPNQDQYEIVDDDYNTFETAKQTLYESIKTMETFNPQFEILKKRIEAFKQKMPTDEEISKMLILVIKAQFAIIHKSELYAPQYTNLLAKQAEKGE